MIATAQEIQAHLHTVLAPSYLDVIDESAAHAGHSGANAEGHGSHLRVRVAAPQFAGLSRVACHRLVYDAARPFLERGLHALAIDIVR